MKKQTGSSDPRVIDGIKHATGLVAKGETASAVRHLTELLEQVPRAASLHGYLAMFLSSVDRLDEAIAHGRQAIQLAPHSENASLVLFEALCKSEQYMEALDEMKRFLSVRPSEEYTRLISEWNLSEDETEK